MLVFWCCSEIFCRFWARFCIKYFDDLQILKHEKRLETDVSSLRNSVIMREIKPRFPFGDRCSTNWAIPLNKKCCVVSLAHLQGLWYHRHAVLSSVFQHKNADLSKNLCSHVWCARQAHFILSKIACALTWCSHVIVAVFDRCPTTYSLSKTARLFSAAAMRLGNTKIAGKRSWHFFSDTL